VRPVVAEARAVRPSQLHGENKTVRPTAAIAALNAPERTDIRQIALTSAPRW
jgi:hypothetical protein